MPLLSIASLAVVHTLRLGVFIASTADFQRQSVVANGASNLLVNALGDKAVGNGGAGVGIAGSVL